MMYGCGNKYTIRLNTHLVWKPRSHEQGANRLASFSILRAKTEGLKTILNTLFSCRNWKRADSVSALSRYISRKYLLFVRFKAHTHRTRYGNATRFWNFHWQVSFILAKIFQIFGSAITSLVNWNEYLLKFYFMEAAINFDIMKNRVALPNRARSLWAFNIQNSASFVPNTTESITKGFLFIITNECCSNSHWRGYCNWGVSRIRSVVVLGWVWAAGRFPALVPFCNSIAFDGRNLSSFWWFCRTALGSVAILEPSSNFVTLSAKRAELWLVTHWWRW